MADGFKVWRGGLPSPRKDSQQQQIWHAVAAMKSLTEHLWFETPHRRDYLNITHTVEALVRKSGIREGLCLVNAMHITTCVAILPPAN
jgi:Uncharacterised protein family UPF0047